MQDEREGGPGPRRLERGGGRKGAPAYLPPRSPPVRSLPWEGGHVAGTEDASETRKGKDLFISCSFLS